MEALAIACKRLASPLRGMTIIRLRLIASHLPKFHN